MRRRRRGTEHENSDRWIIPYADFITLMFAFFTVMYSISRVDSVRLSEFVGSTREAFGPRAQGVPSVVEEIAPVVPIKERMRQDAMRVINMTGASGLVSVRADEKGLALSIGEHVLFDSGQAIIKPSAAGAMGAVASILRTAGCNAVVEGHTDSLPISNERYASNWELSTSRATNVLVLLVNEYGVAPDRVGAAGYAEFRPIASNATPEGRARNRRVDIVLLAEDKEE
ncbi:MAG: OmpA family protein [Syntrophorhabdaceae bacterium]|nr:OmpA family protein [Syntrophorhabdaceae bacterium]